MDELLEDIQADATTIQLNLLRAGYVADFTPASLAAIDRFLDDAIVDGAPRPDGLLGMSLMHRVTSALGAYIGEVVRRDLGGTWRGELDDPDPTLELPGGRVVWPMQRVGKRVAYGSVDGLEAYGAGLGLDFAAAPPPLQGSSAPPLVDLPPTRRRWFGRGR